MMAKVNLAEAFATFHDHWNPRVAGDINNFQVKLVKIAGNVETERTRATLERLD